MNIGEPNFVPSSCKNSCNRFKRLAIFEKSILVSKMNGAPDMHHGLYSKIVSPSSSFGSRTKDHQNHMVTDTAKTPHQVRLGEPQRWAYCTFRGNKSPAFGGVFRSRSSIKSPSKAPKSCRRTSTARCPRSGRPCRASDVSCMLLHACECSNIVYCNSCNILQCIIYCICMS